MIKRNLKKIPKLIAVFAILVTSILGANIPIKAKTPNLTQTFKPEWQHTGTTAWGDGTMLYVDGELSWCIEPGKRSFVGSNEEIKPSDIGYTLTQMQELSMIAWYGYRNRSHTETNYFLTQNLIWKYLGSPARLVSNSYPNDTAMKSFFDDVMDKVNNFTNSPSFDGKTYTVNIGDTLSIPDTKNILNGLNIKSVTGGTATISGNTLKVTPNGKTDDMVIRFNRGMSIAQTETNFVVRGSGKDEYGRTYQSVSKLTGSDPYRASVTINVNRFGSLKIAKQDEDGTYVPNTSFRLSYNANMSDPIGTYKTGSDGTVTVDELLPQRVYVQEIAVPNHLILDSTIYNITIKPNETVSYNAKNDWVEGKVKLRKTDTESGKQVAGATYAIYNSANQELERLITTATGYVESGYLRFGNYTVKEVIAPTGYVLNSKVYPITISSNEQKIEVVGINQRVKGTINLSKEDSVTGKDPQGESSLIGAVYGLYARNNILDPADGSVVAGKGKLISKLITDKNANASISNLYLGDYYIKEIEPSFGYTLDTTEYDVSIAYAGQNVSVVTKTQTVKERVISQAFSIIKISDNGSGETDILKGVEFTVKSKKDIDKAGSWEKAPVAKNSQGKTASILITDEKGYALSDELPYGTYIVRETKVPDNHYQVPEFTVIINKDNREPQPWRIFNDEKFRAVVAIVKQDEDTGKTIKLAGATFKIKNLDTNDYVGSWVWNPLPHYVDSWTTDESGTVMSDNVLDPGVYQLEEVKAPEGYTINNNPVKFTITSSGIFETLPDGTTPVITVKMKDTAVKGKIKLVKEGEVLKGIEKDDKGNIQFIYEKRALKNVVFSIYAKEIIYSPDNQKDILFEKDELVEKVTSLIDGAAESKELPLGQYYVKEIQTQDGYILDDKKIDVTLEYDNQDKELIMKDLGSLENKRKKIDTRAYKKDAQTNTGVKDTIISIFANRDIYNVDGEVIVKAGTCLEKAASDDNGYVHFKVDLPKDVTPEYAIMPIEVIENSIETKGDVNGLVYMVETKAPIGYLKGEEIRCYYDTKFDHKITKQNDEVFENTFYNDKTEVSFIKKDKTNGKVLAGASLEVIDKNKKVIERWISTDKPYVISGLLCNESYTLREVAPAKGYVSADNIEFVVKDTTELQCIEMSDDITKIDVEKISEKSKEYLIGNTLALYDMSGKQIDTWISDDKVHRIEKLEVGKTYVLKELKACSGYTIAGDITFVVEDTKEVQKITMKNHLKPIIQPKVKTGDTSETTREMIISILALVVLAILVKNMKEKRDS